MSFLFRHHIKRSARKTILSYQVRYLAILRRKQFFTDHPERGHEDSEYDRKSSVVPCPACGYFMHPRPRSNHKCGFCGWEYDRCDDPNADTCGYGPNDSTLTQARQNFAVTYCVWHFCERADFWESTQLRIFHPKIVAWKKRLLKLHDELMNLSNPKTIAKQWQKIFKQQKVNKQREKALLDRLLGVGCY